MTVRYFLRTTVSSICSNRRHPNEYLILQYVQQYILKATLGYFKVCVLMKYFFVSYVSNTFNNVKVYRVITVCFADVCCI